MTAPKVITDLTEEPISLAFAKAYCKVDEDIVSENEIINKLIKAARKNLENYTGLAFGPKTFQFKSFGYVKANDLYYGPNQTITEVLDANGAAIDIATLRGSYFEYLRGFTVQNTFVDEFGWDGIPKGIYGLSCSGLGGFFEPDPEYTITYTAGFSNGELPEDLQIAIAKTVADMYQNRENAVIGTIIAELPLSAKVLAKPYRSKVLF